MNQKSSSAMNPLETVKFLYSYGGKIMPRPTDGKLRYVAGHTRVLSVHRSISFSELMLKFGESCGISVNLKCKLPSEDLDMLISVKSDEDLRNVIEEYESFLPAAKIVAVLNSETPANKVSPPSSPISCFDFPSAPKSKRAAASCCRSPAVGCPVLAGKHRRNNPRHFHPQR
ncbi:uncharacterized protein LOC127255245 [Andrographis paniculata]|uniref:uncharacterized protein LOC127255245 n=1 Tax=Andrographis paniculata TaxID=175694 RepID=UPI0021E97CA8|nr:uncharacterized protein LOC127255245 [Andrographis paniculata]XP_051136662.1 uncharacterized protein LOC127255245 [Andrographis paniculata]XP_051136664.1 uncharacterized protein LOC127255245 [Andrographis paniculata]